MPGDELIAEVIEQNLEGIVPWFVYGRTVLAIGLKETTEGEAIREAELYCLTKHGVWRVE